jgi:hypothetical protein
MKRRSNGPVISPLPEAAPAVSTNFWVPQLILAMALNAAVQAIQIGAYASRLAGVSSGRIATSISLFNLFVTVSRLASLVLVPALGALADAAAHTAAVAHSPTVDPFISHRLELQLRLIVFAGTIGTAIGALLLPTFITLFERGIGAFERRGSLLGALGRLADPRVPWSVIRSYRFRSPERLRRFSPGHVPGRLLFFNTLVTSIYAIGVVAAYYASVLNITARTTATGLSGIVNGIGTISFTLFVDPTSAFITDQAVKGERPIEEVKSMVFYLSLTAILGTLISQIWLYPAALLIAWVAKLFYHPHAL